MLDPLRVAIVCGSLSRAAGGIFPIMQAHAKHLSMMGIDVSAYGLSDAFSQLDAASWAPITPHFFARQHRGFGYSRQLSRALLASSVDIVHQHGLWLYPSIVTSRWGIRSRRPVVISTQGMLEPWALSNSRLKKQLASAFFERRNLNGAACLHCSEAEVEGIRRFGLKNPIAVLPNGTDLPTWTHDLPRPSWLPCDGRRTLLFLGRLHPKKGIRETLDAWARVKALSLGVARQWRLVIAGWDDGGHAEALISHSRALGLDGDVIFSGPLYGAEKNSAMAHADAFILASHSEGLPMAVLEAWSHALPVFMTRECNLSEGFTVGAAIEVTTDPVELSSTLMRSLCAADMALIGERGKALVVRRFTWEAIVRELFGVYKWLAIGGVRPACVVMP